MPLPRLTTMAIKMALGTPISECFKMSTVSRKFSFKLRRWFVSTVSLIGVSSLGFKYSNRTTTILVFLSAPTRAGIVTSDFIGLNLSLQTFFKNLRL